MELKASRREGSDLKKKMLKTNNEEPKRAVGTRGTEPEAPTLVLLEFRKERKSVE